MPRTTALPIPLLLALGCGGSNPAPVAVPPGATPASSRAADGPPAKLTAAEFAAAASADPEATLAKYRAVEVAGTVAAVEGYGDRPGGTLLVRGDTGPAVTCVLAGPGVTGEIGRGQTVTVRGQVGRAFKNCELRDCEVIDRGPPTTVRATAAEVMAKFLAPGGAEALADKSLIVSGKVGRIGEAAMDYNQPVEFDVPAGKLVALVDGSQIAYFNGLKPGDELTLAGDVTKVDAKAKTLRIARAVPVKK